LFEFEFELEPAEAVARAGKVAANLMAVLLSQFACVVRRVFLRGVRRA